jgi:hypothetical protein
VRERTHDGWTLTVCYRDDPVLSQLVPDAESATEPAEQLRRALVVQGFFDAEPS